MPHKNFAFLPERFISKRFSPTLDFTNERILPTPIQILLRYKESKIHHGFKLTDYSVFFSILCFFFLFGRCQRKEIFISKSQEGKIQTIHNKISSCVHRTNHIPSNLPRARLKLFCFFFFLIQCCFVHNCS